MRIVLLGPPGCGKGTQGDILEKKYQFPKISTGDLLRNEVQKGTLLGKKAQAKMNKGELVSDDIVVEMIKKRIFTPDCKSGYIMDGFPRNIVQAHMMEEIDGTGQEVVIDIHLKEEVLIKRLLARRICSSCGAIFNLKGNSPKEEGRCDMCGSRLIQRKDDNPEVIKERLKIYREQTEPLIDYYKKKSVYFRVNGEGEVETVSKNICSILERELINPREAEAVR